jgi:HSP20 family protein
MEKPVKKESDLVPISPGPTPLARRRQSLFEHDIDSIFDDFRRSFDMMMRPYYPFETRAWELQPLQVRYAPIDIIDEGTHFLIRAELPGYTKENVDVRITSEGMTIHAKKEEKKEEKNKNYIHRERAYSAFERSVAFPVEVDASKTEGTMKEGILELKVPKKEPTPESKPRKIELK